MDEYFCPNCGATLNDQPGFDPDGGTWTCTSCGKFLMDDDVYDGDTFEGVAWYCDDCGALLNRQSGFSDSYGSWQCTNCGHINGTTQDDIVDDGPKCPSCGATLKDQYSFSDWSDDHTCSECGAKLHRSYSSDPFEVVEEDEKAKCPGCGASLKDQYSFSDWYNDYTCSECGAKLHRDYSSDPFEVVKEDEGPICPRCGDRLKNQSLYSEIDDDWTCEECGAKLHRDYSFDDYEEVVSEDDDDEDEVDDSRQYYHSQTYKQAAPYADTKEKAHADHSSSSTKAEKKIPDSELRKKRVKAFFFKRKKIEIGYDCTDLLRKHYNVVVTALHNKGFNNIKAIPVKDIYKGSCYQVGEVEQVVINGTSYFNDQDQVPYDSEIIITYHEKKEIVIPFAERSLRNMNYIAAGDRLQELGFTEIYEKPIRDLVTGWVKKDGAVEKVTIGSVYPFKKNSVFPYDVEITIEYHTFKKKS